VQHFRFTKLQKNYNRYYTVNRAKLKKKLNAAVKRKYEAVLYQNKSLLVRCLLHNADTLECSYIADSAIASITEFTFNSFTTKYYTHQYSTSIPYNININIFFLK